MKWTIDDALTSAGRGHAGRGAASITVAGSGLSAVLRLRAEGATLPDLLPTLAADLAKRAEGDKDGKAEGFARRLAELQQQQQAAEAKLQALQAERESPDLLNARDLGERLLKIEASEQHVSRALASIKKARHEVEQAHKQHLNAQSVARRQRLDAAVEQMATEAIASRAALLREISTALAPYLDRLIQVEARVGALVFDRSRVLDGVLLSTATAEAA